MIHDSPEEAQSLGTALPKEQARVRKLMNLYREIGPAGAFALMSMEQSLKRADQATISGDVAAMIRCYEELKGFTS